MKVTSAGSSGSNWSVLVSFWASAGNWSASINATNGSAGIASSVLVKGGELPVTSVRLTRAIPKDMIFPVMDEIRKVVLTAPVKAGTIVLHNVCGLDSDVMVTKNVDAC